MNNFIARTITGVLFVATIIVCFLAPKAMVLLFALVTGLTVWEFCGLVNEREDVTVNRFICTAAGVYLFFAMAGYNSGITPSSVFIPYLAFRYNTEEIVYTYLTPLSVFVFLWMNDTGAYLCGSLLGKHKLFPRISPGKSWEGSIGGAVLVIIVAVGIWYLTEQYGVNDLQLSMMEWIGMGLTVVVFGTWGDLIESLFKRTLGIKDSGTILPGHGGMLDRFDSSLLAIPATVVYLYTLTLF